MDNNANFEEMRISKFIWGLWNVVRCSTLKEASKHQAVHGIIQSLLFFVFGVGLYWLLPHLKSASYYGLPSLLVGTLLLIYSFILLSSVLNNQGLRTFRIIKVGCLILLYLELIIKLIFFVEIVIQLADSSRYAIPVGGLIEFFFHLLALFLSGLGIFAIHSDKRKIVSLYIDIVATLFFIIVTLCVICVAFLLLVVLVGDQLGGFPAALRGVILFYVAFMFQLYPVLSIILIICLIFVIILVGSMMDYYLKILVLHLNMLNIAQVKNNPIQLIIF